MLFDVDGVLIDTRESFTETQRRVTQFYLERILGWPAGPWLLDAEDAAQLKAAGGFNDDWLATWAGIAYFVASSRWALPVDGAAAAVAHADEPAPTLWHDAAAMRVREAARPWQTPLAALAQPPLTWSDFAQAVGQAGGGRQGVIAVLSQRLTTQEIAQLRHIVSLDLVTRLCVEHYGGPETEALFGWRPRLRLGPALWRNETLLAAPAVLQQLANTHRLGLYSGRSSVELGLALDLLGAAATAFAPALRFAADRFTKPDPTPLLLAADRGQPLLFVGDNRDDLTTVQRARVSGLREAHFVGVLAGVLGQQAAAYFAGQRADYLAQSTAALLEALTAETVQAEGRP